MDKSTASQQEILALFDSEMRRDPAPEAGITLERTGGVLRGTGSFNFIFHADLDEACVDAAVAEQAIHFSNPPVELQWKVYTHDKPANLGARLAAAGFALEEPETFMVLPLSGHRSENPAPPGIDIRRVSDLSGLEDYLAIAKDVFGYDESWRIEAYGPRLGDPTLAVYVAYADEKAVASGRLEMPQGKRFASLWGGGTLETFRGRGIYKALVDARVREATRMGFRYLTVDAREPSRPILEGLGFLPLSSIRDYTLNRAAH